MPLGEIDGKARVRKIAERLDLPTASKPDSQEICFVPDNDYVSFIERRTDRKPEPGNFIDEYGNVLGIHSGITPVSYTHLDVYKRQALLIQIL